MAFHIERHIGDSLIIEGYSIVSSSEINDACPSVCRGKFMLSFKVASWEWWYLCDFFERIKCMAYPPLGFLLPSRGVVDCF